MRAYLEPVVRILTELQTLTEECSRSWAEVKPGMTFSVAAHDAWEKKEEQFNQLMRPYTSYKHFLGFKEVKGRPVPQFVDMPVGVGTFIPELLEIVRAGHIDRLRKCGKCEDWFFSLKTWGKFCSSACKMASKRAKPGFTERNRVDQRNHYRKRLSPNKRLYRQGLSPEQVRELRRSKKENQLGKKR
jgi:hypothetical protein